MEEIINEHHAVVIAAGSTIPRDLDIPGRDLEGVYFAMDFLKQQNKRVSNKEVIGQPILTTDQNVIVIGGGDTGSDCVGTSNRQGAASVTQLELMPKPPVSRTEMM
ncbi:MAG: FAD-dependent oxidoreductase, partial [Sediminibacterium sp.]